MGEANNPPPSTSPPPPPTCFPLANSADVGISPPKFLTFSFKPFAFKAIPSASPKLLNLNQDQPTKKMVFWSNPYKIKVMITSFIEILGLPNFGHMITSTL